MAVIAKKVKECVEYYTVSQKESSHLQTLCNFVKS